MTVIDAEAFSDTAWLSEKRKENPLVVVNGILIDGTTCTSKMVKVPEGVKRIVGYAFYECDVRWVELPDSIERIDGFAFYECRSLESIAIPNGVTRIERATFDNCVSLKSVAIPESVKSISLEAFYNCDDLTIYCPANSYAETFAKNKNIKYSNEAAPEILPFEVNVSYGDGTVAISKYYGEDIEVNPIKNSEKTLFVTNNNKIENTIKSKL